VTNPSLETLPMIPAGAETPRIAVEPLLTAHRLLEACPGHPKGLEFLHVDLFDSRLPVALSALAAVRVLADTLSFPHLARLIGNANEEVQCAAVRALGSIRHPDTPRLLLDLLKTTRSEKLRSESLAALSEAAPQDKEIVSIIRQAAHAPMGSAGARAHAA
jgi:HEAT repeat protein